MRATLAFAATLFASTEGVFIRVFNDNACTVSSQPNGAIPGRSTINNTFSGAFNVYSGSCTPASMIFPIVYGGGSNVNFMQADVALDVCTPSLVTLAIFSSANRGGDGVTRNDNILNWNQPDACGLPRLFTVSLVPGVCTPVSFTVPGNDARPYRAQLTEYWRLDSVACSPPAPATPTMPLTLRTLWTRDAGALPVPTVGSCSLYAPNTPTLPLPNSDNPLPPRDFNDYFTDLPLLSAPFTAPTGGGFCNPNITIFTPADLSIARPRSTQVSLNVYPSAANANIFNMEVFNNLRINVPGGSPGYYTACNTARDAAGTPTSPHYMGTVAFNLVSGTDGGCQDGILQAIPAGATPPTTRLAAMGVDAFQLSGRLFQQTPYTTSATAPSTPGSAAAAAAATANSALTEASTGLIIGAVGVALAVMAFIALAYSCHMVRAMKNQLETLTPVKGVSEWGAPKAAAPSATLSASDSKTSGLLAGLPGTPTPQPNPLNNASLNAV